MYNYSELLAMMIDNNEETSRMCDREDPLTAAMLKDLLRLCHDYSHQKYDADDVVDVIRARIAEYVVDASGCVPIIYPEDEGAGYTNWEEVDAERQLAMESAREQTNNV
tara:strand:+ start:332 stop:658 length:327 start_codon:yes stop_codon:yes gene_type:complete